MPLPTEQLFVLRRDTAHCFREPPTQFALALSEPRSCVPVPMERSLCHTVSAASLKRLPLGRSGPTLVKRTRHSELAVTRSCQCSCAPLQARPELQGSRRFP